MLPLRAQLPSGLNSSFTQQTLGFSDYISAMRTIIETARLDLTSSNHQTILDANSPFELRPQNYNGEKAILLVHGLFDSPFMMRDLANYFYQRGFLVRAILLPGHGTVPGDLLEINHEEWIKASQYGIDSLKMEAQHIYYGGFSTGGALAIYHALMRENLAGLFLFAPACGLNGKINFANRLFGFTRWITQEDKWIVDPSAQDDYAKYHAFPMNAASEISALIERNNELLKSHHVNMPIFMVLSRDDETIDAEVAQKFFSTQKHARSSLLYYTTHTSNQFNDERISIINSAFPEQHILNFSHICLTIAPDNIHYGIDGDYQEPPFLPTKPYDTTLYQGALKVKYLKQYCFRRLTYNPDFENILGQLDNFLSSNAGDLHASRIPFDTV